MNTKYIFITGGVCSSLGKGITTSSLGAILKSTGLKVFTMKLDPYLNVDPGTMSPFQHGEVYVTNDGAETDLDLGHYERFIDEPLSKESSITSGKIYSEVINNERQGVYLGRTIQIIPHVTDLIKEKIIYAGQKSKADIVLIEIGGTVGDIEGPHYLEAIRQMRNEQGIQNTMFVHVTLLPYLQASKELKTKPTQASIRELRSIGIQPDFIFTRADMEIEESLLKKISMFCDVKLDHVIPLPTLDSIYKVPKHLENYQLSQKITKHFGIKNRKSKLDKWDKFTNKIDNLKEEIQIGIVGKYIQLEDAYLSLSESIKIAGIHNNKKTKIVWIDAEEIEKNSTSEIQKLQECHGIVVAGGFGERGSEGKIQALKYCRKNNKPLLGICLGMQLMAIEYLREKLNKPQLTSQEFAKDSNKKAENYVINFLPGQDLTRKKGGTLRLGIYDCKLLANTKSKKIYKKDLIQERHRHRYEFNSNFKKELSNSDIIISGINPESKLVEIIEHKEHPFYIGCQFHPEFLSRPLNPHPLFLELIKQSINAKI